MELERLAPHPVAHLRQAIRNLIRDRLVLTTSHSARAGQGAGVFQGSVCGEFHGASSIA
jgi:hypothetical protein